MASSRVHPDNEFPDPAWPSYYKQVEMVNLGDSIVYLPGLPNSLDGISRFN